MLDPSWPIVFNDKSFPCDQFLTAKRLFGVYFWDPLRGNMDLENTRDAVCCCCAIDLLSRPSYNSIAPEWAQIGAENSETTQEDSTAKSDAEEGVRLVEPTFLVLASHRPHGI